MKRHLLLLCMSLLALLSSCSTDVDLYADYKQVPVIYGLLDANADTNYIKITRAMYVQGDAYQIALNPDSSNYPGKLDARLIEYCNGNIVREIILDTITIRDKAQGIFYAPSQKLYYTTEKLPVNDWRNKYSYRLKVVLPDRTLEADADLVGDRSFAIQSQAVNFSLNYFDAPSRRFLFHPAMQAGYYDVNMTFTFKEQRTPDGDSVPRTLHWYVGAFYENDLSHNMYDNSYLFYYRPEDFYEELKEFLGGDTAVPGLKRYIGDFPVEVIIAAGGENLRKYVTYNNTANGFISGDVDFSLIDEGYGVFSSRMTVRQRVRLGGETVPELVARTNWGFKFIGGD